jgi:hypothetical protein
MLLSIPLDAQRSMRDGHTDRSESFYKPTPDVRRDGRLARPTNFETCIRLNQAIVALHAGIDTEDAQPIHHGPHHNRLHSIRQVSQRDIDRMLTLYPLPDYPDDLDPMSDVLSQFLAYSGHDPALAESIVTAAHVFDRRLLSGMMLQVHHCMLDMVPGHPSVPGPLGQLISYADPKYIQAARHRNHCQWHLCVGPPLAATTRPSVINRRRERPDDAVVSYCPSQPTAENV